MSLISYLYNKYLEWSSFYRNKDPNQYGTSLYPIKEDTKKTIEQETLDRLKNQKTYDLNKIDTK